jgi:hypothetical protein
MNNIPLIPPPPPQQNKSPELTKEERLALPPDMQVKLMQRDKYNEEVKRLKRENAVADGLLLPVNEVVESAASALKIIIQNLDSIPDKLERLGIIRTPDEIEYVIKITDGIRDAIADEFRKIGK